MTSSKMTSSLLMTSSNCEDNEEGCKGAAAGGEGDGWEEEEDGMEEEEDVAGWKPLPDDAQFPRGSGGKLFFADCLSSRNKYRDDVI